MNNRLTKWAENYFIYVEGQSGLLTINIFILHSLITHFVNCNQLFCAFVDFSKAFDYIVRDNLWYKRIKLGIRGSMLNITRVLYRCTQLSIKIHGMLSEPVWSKARKMQYIRLRGNIDC